MAYLHKGSVTVLLHAGSEEIKSERTQVIMIEDPAGNALVFV